MLKSKIQNPNVKINPSAFAKASADAHRSLKRRWANSKCQISKPSFFHLSFVLCFSFVICALLFVILISGCAFIMETAKGIAGASTKVLEDNRKEAVTQTFNYDYNTCYNKAQKTLKAIGAYIYAKDTKKKMIAIYVTEQDTTPVGLFFKEIDANNTQLEVSSPSTYAKEFIAAKVFAVLDKTMTLEEMEEEIRVQKAKQ